MGWRRGCRLERFERFERERNERGRRDLGNRARPIGVDPHGLAVTANENTAYITARGVADEIKVLNLNGTDVSTILIDPRPGSADRPDSLARKGSNLYVTVRFSGQVARNQNPDGQRGLHRCRTARHNRLCGSWDCDSTLTKSSEKRTKTSAAAGMRRRP